MPVWCAVSILIFTWSIVLYINGLQERSALVALYEGDEQRRAAHLAKTVDVGHEAHRAGHRSTLTEMLRAHGQQAWACDTGRRERQWHAGDHAALEERSKREARAMARMLLEGDARVKGGLSVPGTSVRRNVIRRRENLDDGEHDGGTAAHAAGEDGAGPSGAAAGGDESSAMHGASQANGRQKRKRSDVHTYDETKRRRRRGPEPVYVTTVTKARSKRDSIQMGAAALDRVTRGRYEWRGETTGKRQRELFGETRPEKRRSGTER